MIGPFKKAPDGFRWVYVAIDKFSKWIEYKPLVQSTVKKAAELSNDIIHRFGLPNSIITDLGSTFTGSDIWDFCEDQCISIKYVLVTHPRANGQVERVNGMILDAGRRGYMRRIRNIQANGSKNYQLWSRDLGPSLVAILESPPISWCLDQKSCYLPMLLPEHQGQRIMMKRITIRHDKMMSTDLRKKAWSHVFRWPSTQTVYVNTSTIISRSDPSWSATWYSVGNRRRCRYP